MTDKEQQIEELSKEICNGCKTRHECENNDGFCVMSDVVAEWLWNKGYRKIIPNVDFVVRASELVGIREKAVKDVLQDVYELCDNLVADKSPDSIDFVDFARSEIVIPLCKKYFVEIDK